MQKLIEKILLERMNSIRTILTIPNFDYNQINKDIKEVISELVQLELLNNKNELIMLNSIK